MAMSSWTVLLRLQRISDHDYATANKDGMAKRWTCLQKCNVLARNLTLRGGEVP